MLKKIIESWNENQIDCWLASVNSGNLLATVKEKGQKRV